MNYDFYKIADRIRSERKKLYVQYRNGFLYCYRKKYDGYKRCSQKDMTVLLCQDGYNIEYHTYSKIETGEQKGKTINLDLLAHLSYIFNCSIPYLLCDEDYEHKDFLTSRMVEDLGLSEKAIETIRLFNFSKNKLAESGDPDLHRCCTFILNTLLENSEAFSGYLDSLYSYLTTSDRQTAIVIHGFLLQFEEHYRDSFLKMENQT